MQCRVTDRWKRSKKIHVLLLQPTYSPDLTPSDFYLSVRWPRKTLTEMRCGWNEEEIDNTKAYCAAQEKLFYLKKTMLRKILPKSCCFIQITLWCYSWCVYLTWCHLNSILSQCNDFKTHFGKKYAKKAPSVGPIVYSWFSRYIFSSVFIWVVVLPFINYL